MDIVVDSNNNATVGKYSLRPRITARRAQEEVQEEATQLGRSFRKKRVQRGLPLSRHRRRSANARERSRMKEINEAFAALRKLVAWENESHQKNTKISTLRLAIQYISALDEALRSPGTAVAGESAGDHSVDSFNHLERSGTFSQPQIGGLSQEDTLSLTSKTKEQPQFFQSVSSSVIPENEKVTRSVKGSGVPFQKCSFSLGHRYQQNELLTHKICEVPPIVSKSEDIKPISEFNFRYNIGNPLLNTIQTEIQKINDRTELLDVNPVCVSDTTELPEYNLVNISERQNNLPLHNEHSTKEDHPGSSVHFPQFEDCLNFLPSESEEQPLSFQELFIT